jgi:signal transduction histidine kinase
MDPELEQLIAKTVNTRVKLDVLKYYHDNPHAWESLNGLAQRLGRSAADLEPATASLARDGLLEARAGGRAGKETVYRYRRDGPKARPMARLFEAFAGPKGREVLQAVTAADSDTKVRELARQRNLDDLRTRFVSMVSHELRTPVTAMRGLLATVLKQESHDPETLRPMLERALSQCDRLVILIENLLVLSGLQAGGRLDLYLAELDVSRLVDDVASQFQRADAPHAVVTDLEGAPQTVVADEYLLGQALAELIGNAIKFSPPDGRVRVAVRTQGDQVRFSVSDEGAGILPRQRERVFEVFYQGEEDASRHTAGLGLGLFMARKIVERHGGEIWVASGGKTGMTVCFAVPIAGPAR